MPGAVSSCHGASPLHGANGGAAVRRDGLNTTCTGRNGTYACSETVLQLRKGIVDASRMAWRPYDCPPLSAPPQPEVARLLAGRRATPQGIEGAWLTVSPCARCCRRPAAVCGAPPGRQARHSKKIP